MSNLMAKPFDNKVFSSFSPEALAKIEAGMPEVYRAVKSFGRSNSQTTARLMTLTMLTAESPYRMLRQCLAEIEKRRVSLREVGFDLRKKEATVRFLRTKPERGNEFDLIEAEHLSAQMADAQNSVEGALKDIAVFMDAYNQIREAHGIPEKWDEADFEAAEVRHHVRTCFQHSYRDIMAYGRLGMGTLEYLGQFGIHPQAALYEAEKYAEATATDDNYSAVPLSDWMNAMADKYGNCYKEVLARLGLKNLTVPWAMYREKKGV